MPEPPVHREPVTSGRPPPRPPSPSPTRARRTLGIGVIVFVAGVLGMLLPLAVPLGQLAKYVVTPAFVGACIGLSITANAAIDAWRVRRRRRRSEDGR